MRIWTDRLEGNQLDLAVHRFADESADRVGITVLLLHGFMDSGRTWDLVAAGLASQGYDIYAPDFRGFGGSNRVGAGGYYHFADYVADIAALVRQIPHDPLVIVGHSMGGTVASLYVGAHPEQVDKLVLMEGAGPPNMEPDIAVVRMRRWLSGLRKGPSTHGMACLEDAITRLAYFHPRVDESVLATRARLLTRVEADGTLVWSFDPLHRTTSPSAFRGAELEAFLGQITCPVLFIGGGPTGWHPPDEQARLDALPSPVQRVDLDDAGHMMHWTEPLACARAIIDFLDQPG